MIELLYAAIATYGLSAIVSNYDGPWSIFYRLRRKYPQSALTCLLCTSTWISAPIAWYFGVGISGYLVIVGVIAIVEGKL